MKIALLSFEYPPETGFGGIGSYTWYHARALVKLGHEVHVLAGATSRGPHRPTAHDGVTVHRFRSGGPLMAAFGALGKLGLWWSKNRLETALSMYHGLRTLLRRHRFDIVEMPECGGEGVVVNHRLDVRTVVRFHSPARLIMPYYDVRPADIHWCGRIEQIGIRAAGAFTSCSQFLATEVSRRLGVAKPVRVIPNGIDLALFDQEEQSDFRRQFDLPRDRPVIFFSGRMERRKGIELCTEIATSILTRFPVALVMAGQDLFNYVSETLLPSVQRHPLRGSIHYLGRLDLASVRSGLRQSDIFLLPSLWENCPYSCLEAMAAGRAIVSTDQGGMPELIHDGANGLLARSGDAGSYVRALELLIADRALRDRLGAAARATVEASHTDVLIAQQAVEFYRDGPPSKEPVADSVPEPVR
ncbi:MAG: glycosyltransferase family 4 protein [Gemmatimonadales bacterium]